jgi:hypothetical protein
MVARGRRVERSSQVQRTPSRYVDGGVRIDIYALVYPDFPGEPGTAPFFENFRNIVSTNPCPSTGQLPS